MSARNARLAYRTDIWDRNASGEKTIKKIRANKRADTQVRPYNPIAFYVAGQAQGLSGDPCARPLVK
ncbi:MAG: hypothetical protein F4X91_12590 [Nitrospinae bacterium]|nr:hypothetical protein [Nitrospinota bacterium]